MASVKLHKPANETVSNSHEEHKFSQKISEMTAKVFGHKQHENQQVAKHCTTCRCPAPQKKQEKQQTVTVNPTTRESKPTEARKNEKKEHKDKSAHQYFLNVTDHLKEKISMLKKNKDDKNKDNCSSSSDSSDSESDDNNCGKKKKKNTITINNSQEKIMHRSKK